MLTSHAERNTGLWVGNATYLSENGRLTERIMFKTFILRFTLRIHILKRASWIRSEKTNSCWGSPVPHPPLAILLEWLVHDPEAATKISPRPCNTQALQALNTVRRQERQHTHLACPKPGVQDWVNCCQNPQLFPAQLSRSGSCSFCSS